MTVQCAICNDSGFICVGTSGSDWDGNAPILEPCDCKEEAKAPSEYIEGFDAGESWTRHALQGALVAGEWMQTKYKRIAIMYGVPHACRLMRKQGIGPELAVSILYR